VSAGSAAGAYTRHGLLFAGCCWALMGLLIVGAAMNLAWVAALALVVVSTLCPARGPKAMQYVTAAACSGRSVRTSSPAASGLARQVWPSQCRCVLKLAADPKRWISATAQLWPWDPATVLGGLRLFELRLGHMGNEPGGLVRSRRLRALRA
jgi:hypothetical protein